MTKFTAVFFAIYGLYTGEFISTLKVVAHVPLILVPLGKLFAYHFALYFVYAYVIVTYTPLVFFSIFLSRGLLNNIVEKLQTEKD